MLSPIFLTLPRLIYNIAVPVSPLVFVPKAQQMHHLVHQDFLLEALVSKLHSQLIVADFDLGLTDYGVFRLLKDHFQRGVVWQLLYVYPLETSVAVELADGFLNLIPLTLSCNMRMRFKTSVITSLL